MADGVPGAAVEVAADSTEVMLCRRALLELHKGMGVDTLWLELPLSGPGIEFAADTTEVMLCLRAL